MQLAEIIFGKIEVQLAKQILKFFIFQIGSTHLHTACQCHEPTAGTILQRVGAQKIRMAYSMRTFLKAGSVQGAEVNSGEVKVRFSEKKLNFSFFKTGPPHLHTALHCHKPKALITSQCLGAGRVCAASSTRSS